MTPVEFSLVIILKGDVTNMTHVYSGLVLTYISISYKINFYLYQIQILN